MKRLNYIVYFILFLGIVSCNNTPKKPSEKKPIAADILVVGAGISGLSAALEAAERGASVLIVEVNSVGGGHAVKATGVAIAGTELQRQKGVEDSPGKAYLDWMAYGEKNHPYWTRKYADSSSTMVYNWLTDMGVEFTTLGKSPDAKVPRFHISNGKAVNIVIPMLTKAYNHPNISFLFNTRAKKILLEENQVIGLQVQNERTQETLDIYTGSVILATGGFEGAYDLMKNNWPREINGDQFLIGAGEFAQGNGHEMVKQVQGKLHDMDQHVIFINGLPDPRDKTGKRGLVAGNRMGIWINDKGKRFVNEWGDPKIIDPQIFTEENSAYWLVFDARSKEFFKVSDAVWLSQTIIDKEILEDTTLTKKAVTIEELAKRTGMPSDTLKRTIDRYNRFATIGKDEDFNRFTKKSRKISTPPFYAVRLYPLTRKNLGGIAIDTLTRVLNEKGEIIDNLYAVGESTGVAGINGKYGMSGTFLGPSVFMGRIAARTALSDHKDLNTPIKELQFTPLNMDSVNRNIAAFGFWHYQESHKIIEERKLDCMQCHDSFSQTSPLNSKMRIARLGTCVKCH